MNQSIRESIFHPKKITSFAYRDLTVERKRESIIGGRKKVLPRPFSVGRLLWLFPHASSRFLVLLEKKK